MRGSSEGDEDDGEERGRRKESEQEKRGKSVSKKRGEIVEEENCQQFL